MLRILLFLGTNFAVLAVVGVVFQILGLEGILAENGVDLDLTSLLVFSAVVGFSGSLISLFMSKTMAKRGMGVQLITEPRTRTERWLLETVRNQSENAGIGMPEVGIFQSPQPNAFATGARRNNALVAVSTGLLENMTSDEVEAVLGHEVSHVANGDMITLTLIQGVVNTFVIFLSRTVGHLVDRIVFRTERGYGPGYYIVSFLAQILFSVLATMVVMWFSRRREFRADEGGAELAGRQKMINALKRLQAAHEPGGLPQEFAAFGISGDFKSLFSSHPPLAKRIAALEAAPPR